MKRVLFLSLLICFIFSLNTLLASVDTVFVTLNLPDPCSCDNSELNEVLYVQSVNLQQYDDTCFNATQTIIVGEIGAPFIMQQGAFAEMIAGEKIVFKPYTHIQAGGQLHAYIAPGGPFCGFLSKSAQLITELTVITNSDEESSQEVLFKVYPNPTTGLLTLELFETNQSSPYLLEIYNSTGNRLKMECIDQSSHQSMNLSGLPPGIYFIALTGYGFKKVEKLIKL
ncbi:MAG TPA: T9SS type A sorting domain-containing protein [Prolixibacteraceae bacterium]|nr:T9SS type A sorting domain-containing protein [Prolixibacteraceae bacterium]